MKVALAQLNTHVGAIDANVDKVLETARRARDDLGCGLAVFPELTLCGYPPEDLLLHRGMRLRVEAALEQVRKGISGIAVYVGFPEYDGERIYNAGAFISDGRILALHRKIVLPNYSVFDEKRYFEPGIGPSVVEFGGIRFGLTICEDTWQPDPCRATVAAGADVILILNGSPFHRQKQQVREEVLAERARENGRALVYVNMVGGQDELVFDGGSVAVTSAGTVAMRAPAYDEGVFVAELGRRGDGFDASSGDIAPLLPHTDSIYRALVMGTRDYVVKNHFDGVILGLSGGVDSALTMCVAV
ncbi:MAG: NAD+ synthase, partial [Gammaproteobacteria bacterium]|nr:NAD+ synthase [Gammaproteobacteria bacterium]